VRDQHLQIIEALGVAKEFDASAEAERRTAFLADYMQASSCGALVLGISGGVDSLTAGLLAQTAVNRLRGIRRSSSRSDCLMARRPTRPTLREGSRPSAPTA